MSSLLKLSEIVVSLRLNMKLHLSIAFFCLLSLSSLSQVNVKDSILSIPMASLSYAYQIPGGDLADRFGANSNVGVSFLHKLKNNLVYGVEFDIIFGNDIIENGILDNLKTEQGVIIGEDGLAADVVLYERGFYTSLKGGWVLPVLNRNPSSGIFILAGAGLLQHKIRIDVANNTAPQLTDDTKKGYDRLTNGFAINQFVGYLNLSNSRLFNFYIGIDITQAWTKNRRNYNFDTMTTDDSQRFDMLYGARIGWIIPFYKRGSVRTYYD